MATTIGFFSRLSAVLPNPAIVNEPQRQRVENQYEHDGGQGPVAQGQLGQRQTQQHVVGKDSAQAENGLRHAIEVEHPGGHDPADHEDDETAAEERDQQPGIHRRQLRKIAQQVKQQRGQQHREHGLRANVGPAALPPRPQSDPIAGQNDREQRGGEEEELEHCKKWLAVSGWWLVRNQQIVSTPWYQDVGSLISPTSH